MSDDNQQQDPAANPNPLGDTGGDTAATPMGNPSPQSNTSDPAPQGTEQPSGGGNTPSDSPQSNQDPSMPPGNESTGTSTVNTTDAPQQQPDNQGEQSASGTTPSPDAGNDTLADAQAAGTQLGETPENPQPLNVGDDVNKAEENK